MKLKVHYPYYLANEPKYDTSNLLSVHDKFSLKEVCKVSLASRDVIDQAITMAVCATEPMRKLAAYQRQDILRCFRVQKYPFHGNMIDVRGNNM